MKQVCVQPVRFDGAGASHSFWSHESWNSDAVDVKLLSHLSSVCASWTINGPNGKCCAFAVATRCSVTTGHVNLVAQSEEEANALWSSACAFLGKRSNVSLHVPSPTATLFESYLHAATWSLNLYQGQPDPSQYARMRAEKVPVSVDLHFVHAQMILVEDLAAYDRAVAGYLRVDWLRQFLNHSNSLGQPPESVALVATHGVKAEICGYAVMRPGRKLAKLGPLYADNDLTAVQLLVHLLGSHRVARDCGFEAFVPSTNASARKLLEKLGLQHCDQRSLLRLETSSAGLSLANMSKVYCCSYSESQHI